uniref:hAT-like transposase RNase-H fold domain-containing protein n=1 Tax=Lactuca sativa TaxID=4236 RepID=A0A9R1WEZ6_LACSA|nr:hypothetical protein LSAT_V11C200062030 [Lactuca sativa]
MLSVALEYREVFKRLSKKDKHLICLPFDLLDETIFVELESIYNDIIKSMTSTMLIKFKKYWNVIHNVTSVAIVLDPSYMGKKQEVRLWKNHVSRSIRCSVTSDWRRMDFVSLIDFGDKILSRGGQL